MAWNREVDMDVDTVDKPPSRGRTILRNSRRGQKNAMKQHRRNEWKTAIYRRANGIIKKTRPALKEYEWGLIGRSATWPEYKRMTSTRECGVYGER